MESSNMYNNVYQHGKIYKIVDIGYNEQYVGSTTVELSTRMSRHRAKYREYNNTKQSFYSSFILFDKYGIENCKIELIELYPCESKEELNRREGYWIKHEECVNKYVAGRTKQEYHVDNIDCIKLKKKEYRLLNLEQEKQRWDKYKQNHHTEHLEYNRNYYIENKKEILEKQKEYRELHKDKISERSKEYRENHKDIISEKKQTYYNNNKEDILNKQKNIMNKTKT
jgi:hypothetical protein